MFQPSEYTSVADYYAGKSIFITGGTGFIGKVLIEKLLRSCPDIKRVYLLIRPKKKQDIHQRLEQIASCKLFDVLRKDQPDFADRICPVFGDILTPNLGIRDADRQQMEEDVNIVFHGAATVRFDEPLRHAMEMNVLGVRKMIRLCQNFKHLEAFVHLSTAYANCDRPFIEEVIYPPQVEPDCVIKALEWMDDGMIESVLGNLLGNKPNTYTYSKHLAEHLLVTEGAGMPIAIIRPSIVAAIWKSPIQGWIDIIHGPSGLCIAAGKGLLRAMKGDNNAVADIVPVDIVANTCIASGWFIGVKKPTSVPVFHNTTGAVNPIIWGTFTSYIMDYFKKIPLDAAFRRPNVNFRTNTFLHEYYIFVSHMIPAYLMDFAYTIIGKKPRMVRLYSKLHRAVSAMSFFTVNSWEWTHNNMAMLRSELSEEDLKVFYTDTKSLDWKSYMENYCMGAKTFVLNEDMADVPAARAHMRKLRNIRYTFNTLLAVLFWRVLIARSQIARNLWFLIMGLVFRFVRNFRITSTIRKEMCS